MKDVSSTYARTVKHTFAEDISIEPKSRHSEEWRLFDYSG